MSDTQVASYIRPALPWAVGLVGTALLGLGAYAQVSPLDATFGFGILPTTTTSTSGTKINTTQNPLSPIERSYIRTQGIRDIVSGITFLSLTYYWQNSDICKVSPVAAVVAKRTIGIYMSVGALIGLGDGFIVGEYAKDATVQGDAVKHAKTKSLGHVVGALGFLGIGVGCLFL